MSNEQKHKKMKTQFENSVSETNRKFLEQFDRAEVKKRFTEVYNKHKHLFGSDATIEELLKRRTTNICLMYGDLMAKVTMNSINNYAELRNLK